MSGSVSLAASISFLSSLLPNAPEGLRQSGLAVATSGANYTMATQSIPTTAGGTALALGAVGTPGWCMIFNLDTVNYVTILNAASGNACIKILAGEFALFRCGSAAPAVLANTGAVTIQYIVMDN